ncbi:hypothetical protein [Cacao yellow vein banding virus]|uniref:P2 n=1 Tax=Cacao yellow vein banding virus TaxID=2169726 RepID=A0A1P8SRJ6_9VIRU|nr:hypothetical protein [Cacao yellow vein banding virus]APY26396.1 hypothetical protein [Cacao yellow vein banding virus]
MSLADKKADPSFVEAITQIQRLGEGAGFEVSSGATASKGISTIISQLNVLVYQITALHQKVDALDARVRAIQAGKATDYSDQLEKLTADLSNLSLGTATTKPVVKKKVNKVYFYKDPKQILQEEKTKWQSQK